MPIKVELKGNKTIVETDFPDSSGVAHSSVYDDRELLSAMRNYGITKLESNVDEDYKADSSLRDEFDKQYSKKYGKNYFAFWLRCPDE